MKAVVLCLLLFGCGVAQTDEPSPASRVHDQELAGGSCEPTGVCRKGHCLAGEDWSTDLDCNHDLGCCVPVTSLAPPQFCEDERVGGHCRKGSCRPGEHFDGNLECGTDAACCAPD